MTNNKLVLSFSYTTQSNYPVWVNFHMHSAQSINYPIWVVYSAQLISPLWQFSHVYYTYSTINLFCLFVFLTHRAQSINYQVAYPLTPWYFKNQHYNLFIHSLPLFKDIVYISTVLLFWVINHCFVGGGWTLSKCKSFILGMREAMMFSICFVQSCVPWPTWHFSLCLQNDPATPSPPQ